MRLLFKQGPYAGRVVDVNEAQAVIDNYLDTGYCEVAPPEPEEEKPKKRAKKKTSKARAKKPETPEG